MVVGTHRSSDLILRSSLRDYHHSPEKPKYPAVALLQIAEALQHYLL